MDDQGRDRRMTDTPDETDAPTEETTQVVDQTLSKPDDAPQQTIPSVPVPTKRMHFFTSFCEMPDAVTFENQEDGEKILLLLRKSFLTNVSWIFFSLILIFVPMVIFIFFHPWNTPLSFLSPAYVLVLICLYYLIVCSYTFISFITWYFNISLITSQRVVDVDFSDLVYKNVAETKLDLVQDVSFTQTGVLRTMFNFGDILIQTAGTIDNFNLIAVPHPDRTVEVVEKLIGKRKD